MKFSEFITLARLFVPGAKQNQVSDVQLKQIINNGALDVASFTNCMDKKTYFNLEEDVQEYSLSTVASDFLAIKKNGIWVYNGSRYQKCYPKTEKWLDEEYINWRGSGTGLPQYYYQDENTIGFYRTPSEDVTDGALMYHYRKPETMVEDDDVAFHVVGDKKTAISALLVLDDSVLDYCKWKLAEPLSKVTGEIISRRNDYYLTMQERMKRISRREDIRKDGDTKRRQRRSCAPRS